MGVACVCPGFSGVPMEADDVRQLPPNHGMVTAVNGHMQSMLPMRTVRGAATAGVPYDSASSPHRCTAEQSAFLGLTNTGWGVQAHTGRVLPWHLMCSSQSPPLAPRSPYRRRLAGQRTPSTSPTLMYATACLTPPPHPTPHPNLTVSHIRSVDQGPKVPRV